MHSFVNKRYAILAAVVAALLAGACTAGGTDAARDGGSGEAVGAVTEADGGGGAGGGDDAFYDSPMLADQDIGAATSGGLDAPQTVAGPDVIKTAEISIEVGGGDLAGGLQKARATADRHGGYVVSTYTEGKGARTGSLTMRVPARAFEQTVSELEDLGHLLSESITGQDVSQEFVDLTARLRHYESQETVMLQLMRKARSVQDTIRVQSELRDVQLEIERLTGQIRYLRDQADLSTISVHMHEEGAVAPAGGTLARAWRRAVEGAIAVVAGTIVALGTAFPVLAFIALAWLGARTLRPRRRAAA